MVKNIRVTYTRRHSYATKSNVTRVVKTPGILKFHFHFLTLHARACVNTYMHTYAQNGRLSYDIQDIFCCIFVIFICQFVCLSVFLDSFIFINIYVSSTSLLFFSLTHFALLFFSLLFSFLLLSIFFPLCPYPHLYDTISGGRLRAHYVKKKGSAARCGDCGGALGGVKAVRPRQFTQKTKRSVSRAYGGSRCAGCVRNRIVRAFLIEEQKIVKKVLLEKMKKSKSKK